MAQVLGELRRRVRIHMRDTRPGKYAVGTWELNQLIEAMVHDVDSELDSGQTWILAAIMLNPATSPPDYPLPTGSEYQNLLDLRRASDGFILEKLAPERIAQRRWNNASAQAAKVTAYSIQQSVVGSLETLTVLFDVRPNAVDTIDLLSSTMLADMANNDSAVIPFPRDFMECFQRGVAARAIEMMSPEHQQARGFTAPSPYVSSLSAAYEKGLKKERNRLIYLEMSQPREYGVGDGL
jgi:hypothetical protein